DSEADASPTASPSPFSEAPASAAREPEAAYANSAFEDYFAPASGEAGGASHGFAFAPEPEPGQGAYAGGPAEIDLSMFVSGNMPMPVDAPPAGPAHTPSADEVTGEAGAAPFTSYTGSLLGSRLGDVERSI